MKRIITEFFNRQQDHITTMFEDIENDSIVIEGSRDLTDEDIDACGTNEGWAEVRVEYGIIR